MTVDNSYKVPLWLVLYLYIQKPFSFFFKSSQAKSEGNEKIFTRIQKPSPKIESKGLTSTPVQKTGVECELDKRKTYLLLLEEEKKFQNKIKCQKYTVEGTRIPNPKQETRDKPPHLLKKKKRSMNKMIGECNHFHWQRGKNNNN